jgi:hypothetical protein
VKQKLITKLRITNKEEKKLRIIFNVFSGQLMSKEHRTHAASERKDDLWCYQCDTIGEGESCINITGNHSSLVQKCKDDKRTCMVFIAVIGEYLIIMYRSA